LGGAVGYVSILEDAIKRLDSDLHLFEDELPPNPERVSMEQWKSAVGLIARGEMILAEAAKHLDLATDPTLDLAHALRVSAQEAADLKRSVAEFQKTSLSLMSRVTRLEAELKELQLQRDSLKTERNQLERKLEEMLKTNPGTVYTTYFDKKAGRK
jgi:septal ring factor EnvC (AmiA/AmiB activator)